MGVVIALTPGAPVPALLVAVTWKVYGVPLVRPLIVLLVEGALTVVVAGPLPVGGSGEVAVVVALPAEAVVLVGGVGVVAGVAVPTLLPGEPVPTLLVAVTWKV